jgi:hypothetical protein
MQTIRTTLNLDRELLEEAAQLRPGLTRTAVIEEALRALVARRLAALGGTAPDAAGPPRGPRS